MVDSVFISRDDNYYVLSKKNISLHAKAAMHLWKRSIQILEFIDWSILTSILIK